MKIKGGRLVNSETATPITDILMQQKKISSREKKLKGMKWAMGIEHESHYFYIPKEPNLIYPLNEIVLFNSLEPTTKILNENKELTERERNLLLKLDFELTGRKCNGKVVLDKTPVPMPEFITDEPFSTINNPKNIENYYKQLIEKEEEFIKIIEKIRNVKEFNNNNNFLLNQYPFAMSSNIRVRKNYNSLSKSLLKKHYIDYCGSYHYTITLPFKEKNLYTKNDEKKFVDEHYNFGAMFQWIEPLLLAAFFSCDQDSVGTKKRRIKGSFRIARIGWGNLAGSDMRKTDKGIGRYANVKPYWRNSFDFYQSDIVDLCMQPNPKLGEKNAVSSFSSNIRTFGPDPDDPEKRISGAKMTIPNGVEIRIFDHFPSNYLIQLLRIIILIAANSYRNKVDKFVYEDEEWIKTTQKIMLKGWKANIDPLFINKLENILDIKIILKSYKAYDVLCAVVDELYEKNKNSDIVYMMYGGNIKPIIPQINRYSWDFAFMLKLIGDKKVYQKYLKFIEKILENNKIKFFKDNIIKIFGKEWKNNIEDILWFFESKKMIAIEENTYRVDKKNIKEMIKLDTINELILIQLNLNALINKSRKNNYLKKELSNLLNKFDGLQKL